MLWDAPKPLDLRKPSYKGVAFYTRDISGEVGRRTVSHTYPFRDFEYDEDMGRAPKTFRITAIFQDFLEAKKLLNACESAGDGVFVHPWGQVQRMVLKTPAKIRYPLADGGEFEIELDLKETGDNAEPAASDDPEGLLAMATSSAQNTIDAAFSAQWLGDVAHWLDNAAACVDTYCTTIEGYLSPLTRGQSVLSRMQTSINSIINRPLLVALRVRGLITSLVSGVSNPFGGLTGWSHLFRSNEIRQSAGVSGTSVTVRTGLSRPSAQSSAQNGQLPSTYTVNGTTYTTGSGAAVNPQTSGVITPTWAQPRVSASNATAALTAMPPSLCNYVRQTELLTRIDALPTASFVSKHELLAARAQVLSDLDFELKNSNDDVVVRALQTVRVAAGKVMAEMLPQLADVRSIETLATLPAVLIVYSATGGIAALDDFIGRNGVKHAGFVPAGNLEVLNVS
ncbi:hypothetical protein DTO96_102530 [Ephemeroptericola cinctiostellae]|uniref:DNA circulation N-terminal domain-containing protein n=1 Tax=Ephemeroptericola cinctiostellae TaxID=2268024 RepID=A0A345DEI6_9BURK|nr:DNA circularization N-terminal domain-containing protein [Ephemeroptericola cinctiostellae]AXF86774.1 hypothetical protein DTO96_102530 [Ephemeroptericola cinctiostellae]